MAGYFKDIWTGVTTVLIGMKVTFKHLFVPSITVQYPRETLQMNERSRARLVNHTEICSYCLGCKRACPVDCFTIRGIRAGKDEDLGMLPTGKPKKMHVVQFDIDFGKCLYCGLCVDACETGSLRWESPQEDSTYSREAMHKSFTTYSPEEVERLVAQEAAEKAAKAAAKAKAAAAKAAAKPKPKPVPEDKNQTESTK